MFEPSPTESISIEASRGCSGCRVKQQEIASLKVERDQHIETGANKFPKTVTFTEFDWFSEKHRADLLEAEVARLQGNLIACKTTSDIRAAKLREGLEKLERVRDYVLEHNDILQNSPGHFSQLTTLAREALAACPKEGK